MQVEKDANIGLLALSLFSIIMGGYAINYIVKTERAYKKSTISAIIKDPYPLIHFTYTAAEWKIFIDRYFKTKFRLRKILVSIATIVVTFVLFMASKESIELVAILSILIAFMAIPLLILFRNDSKAFREGIIIKDSPDVLITQLGILLNQSYLISYNGNDARLDECSSESVNGWNFLVLHIRRPVPGNPYNYQILSILIPKNKEHEMEKIISRLNDSRVK